jgi:tetratricopeptide (TPR) repeat protein
LIVQGPDAPLYRQMRARGHGILALLTLDPARWAEAEVAGRFAVRLGQHLLGDFPDSPTYRKDLGESWRTLGVVLKRVGKTREAVAAFDAALKLPAEDPQVPNDLAWLLATCPEPSLRDPDRAVALAQQAVLADPGNGGYWNTLGVAYYRAGRWEDAVAALEESMRKGQGDSTWNWLFLAMARWQLGDQDGSRRYYDRAVALMEKHAGKDDELLRFRAEAKALLGL